MEPTLEDGLRILEEAADLAKHIRIDIDDDYVRGIAIIEALPENQSGADKTWVWNADRAFREYFKRVRPL